MKRRNKKKTNNKEKGKELERRDTAKTRHVLEDNGSTDDKDNILTFAEEVGTVVVRKTWRMRRRWQRTKRKRKR